MSLFEKIKSRKINLTEQSFTDKQRSDMKKLLNKNFGTKEISKKTADTQKNLSKANKEVFNVTGKSAVRDAKKYASGEYPKIGGGTRIGSKSKGSGAETGAKVNLNTTSGSKSKGTTPVRVNITKPIKQSEVSKKAKQFTTKINKANVNRKEFKFDPKTKERQTFRGKITSGPQKGQSYTIFRRDGGDVKKGVDKGVIPKAAKGAPIEVKSPAHKDLFKRYGKGESKATQFMIDLAKDDRKARGLGKRAERIKDASGGKKTGSLRKGNLSFPGDRTGVYSTTKSQIDFNKALKRARGNTEGDLPKETPQSVRDYAKGVRDKRIKKYKLPDTSFDSKTKAPTKFDDIFKGVKKTKKFKSGGPTQFDISKTPVGKMKLPPKKVSPEVQKKTFDKFSKEISDATKQTKKVSKKIGSIKPPKTPSQPETGFGGTPGSQPVGGTSGSSTKTVKQSEVSKQAKDFTQKIKDKKFKNTKVKGDPLIGNFDYDEPLKKSKPKKIPPKPSSTPPTDPPGKLVQGRDFSSKKAYDAKLAKQVKILRGKAENLRAAKLQASGEKIPGVRKTGLFSGNVSPETRKKLASRQVQRIKTADALERSLKRQGVKGPTGMLPVVSGAGANEKVKAFGNKTFKQFYKDAGVSKREPIKPIQQIKDTTKKKRIINKKYSSNTANLGNTAFNQNVRGIYKKIPKALRSKTLYRIGKAVVKNPYVGAAVGLGLGSYAAYKGIKALTNKPKVRTLKTSDLKSKKIGSTVTHGRDDPKGKFKKGDPVRFDALGLGFTKKDGVQKKKPTSQDFQSGKYTFK